MAGGTGGTGGGGTGGNNTTAGSNATGYGSGGGGGGGLSAPNAGGNGSAGIIIIRYRSLSIKITKLLDYAVKSDVKKTYALAYDVRQIGTPKPLTGASFNRSRFNRIRFNVPLYSTSLLPSTSHYNRSGFNRMRFNRPFDITETGTRTLTYDLLYSVKSVPKLALGTAYAVHTIVKQTFALAYDVLIGGYTKLTYDLKYAVKSQPDKTYTLLYDVRHRTKITPALDYAVKKKHNTAEALDYAVKSSTKLTYALRYWLLTTPAPLEYAFDYAVKREPVNLTRILDYAVKSKPKLTFALKYEVDGIHVETKQYALDYAVASFPAEQTFALDYSVKTDTKQQFALDYAVKNPTDLTYATDYAVKFTPAADTAALDYAVKSKVKKTYGLQYEVKNYVVKNRVYVLDYSVKSKTATVYPLEYSVRYPYKLTYDQDYAVKSKVPITPFALHYMVQIPPDTGGHDPLERRMSFALRYIVPGKHILDYVCHYHVRVKRLVLTIVTTSVSSADKKTILGRILSALHQATKGSLFGGAVPAAVSGCPVLDYAVKSKVKLTYALWYAVDGEEKTSEGCTLLYCDLDNPKSVTLTCELDPSETLTCDLDNPKSVTLTCRFICGT